MAKLKKRRLRWEASKSAQVVGYRLYWTTRGRLDYDSDVVDLGNVTEVVLPDEIEGFPVAAGPIEIGLTAVDELGNESDMTTLRAPYQFNVPEAPTDLKFETTREYFIDEPSPPPREPRNERETMAAEYSTDRVHSLPFADLLPIENHADGK